MNITKQQLKQLIKEEIEKQFSKEQKRNVDEGVFGKDRKRSNCGPYNRASCEKQVEMQAAIVSIATTLNDVLNQLASLRENR